MTAFMEPRHLHSSETSSPLSSSHGGRTGHSPSPQPLISMPTSQSLSGDLYKTALTNLNRYVRGVLNPSKVDSESGLNCQVDNIAVLRDC